VIDLVCLLADKSIEAAIDGILRRPDALGIRDIDFETVVHPRRDPGCFHEARELLAGYATRAHHALVVLDREWKGAPASTGAELERLLEESLRLVGPAEWVRAVAIDPELEVWVFSDSPHVATALGWPTSVADLRADLEREGLWVAGRPKPRDPKAAVDWVLRRTKRPRSSSVYRELASSVGVGRCDDRSFTRLARLLRDWFGAAHLDR
jgi:hypothetical protein